MTLNLDPNWRRTVLALVFAGAGMALLAFAAVVVAIVAWGAWPVALAAARLTILGNAIYLAHAGLALVLVGLAMTVALRQVSGKFMGGEFSASGGDGSALATVTTTTEVKAGEGQ